MHHERERLATIKTSKRNEIPLFSRFLQIESLLESAYPPFDHTSFLGTLRTQLILALLARRFYTKTFLRETTCRITLPDNQSFNDPVFRGIAPR